ncbi:MAG: substrate-binding domain-containing protein [Flavobacteriales bacterium]
MIRVQRSIYFFLIAFAMLSEACNVAQDKNKNTITSGVLKLGVDESYSLLMDTEVYTYTSLNKYAKIDYRIAPEQEVLSMLLKDSIQAAVISRPLNQEELDYFKSIQRIPQSTLIAHDGVALVVHPQVKDTVVSMAQLQQFFSGKNTEWSQWYPGSNRGKIQVVFDYVNSCNARTIKEKFGIENFPEQCYSLNSTDSVIRYVASHPGAMGIISLSWITDEQDSVCKGYRKLIRPLGIQDPNNIVKPDMPRRPFQAYVFDGTYPLRRDVYYIRTGLSGSLGTGFANHLAGEKGQLIIHRMGMVAANTPNRIIKIKE